VYRFANVKEAEAFQKGLLDEVIPDGAGEWALAAVPVVGPAFAAVNAVDYLRDNASKLESASASHGVGVASSVGFAGLGIEQSAAASVKHDLKSGETTAAFKASGSGTADLGLEGFRAAGEVEAELTLKEGFDPSKLTLTGQIEGSAGVNPGPFTFHEGQRGTFKAALDLTDPGVRDAARSYLEAVSHGRIEEANLQVKYLLSQGDVSVSLDHVDVDKLGKDFGSVYASGERTTVTNEVFLARPPGGGWVRYDGK
jgi:hypothetical protein